MAIRTTTPLKKVENRWELDCDGLKAACKVLGIDNPQNIRVARTSHARRGGCCRPKKIKGVWEYHITAEKHYGHYDAVRILLHELRHVWQHQQHLKNSSSEEEAFMKWRLNARRGGSSHKAYLNRPIEIDARRAERRVHEFMDIVRWI